MIFGDSPGTWERVSVGTHVTEMVPVKSPMAVPCVSRVAIFAAQAPCKLSTAYKGSVNHNSTSLSHLFFFFFQAANEVRKSTWGMTHS